MLIAAASIFRLHVWRMIVDSSRRYNASLVRYTTCPAHGDAIRFAQPVRFHALLCGDGVVAIEDAVTVQQRRGRQHGDVATCATCAYRVCCMFFFCWGFEIIYRSFSVSGDTKFAIYKNTVRK